MFIADFQEIFELPSSSHTSSLVFVSDLFELAQMGLPLGGDESSLFFVVGDAVAERLDASAAIARVAMAPSAVAKVSVSTVARCTMLSCASVTRAVMSLVRLESTSLLLVTSMGGALLFLLLPWFGLSVIVPVPTMTVLFLLLLEVVLLKVLARGLLVNIVTLLVLVELIASVARSLILLMERSLLLLPCLVVLLWLMSWLLLWLVSWLVLLLFWLMSWLMVSLLLRLVLRLMVSWLLLRLRLVARLSAVLLRPLLVSCGLVTHYMLRARVEQRVVVVFSSLSVSLTATCIVSR